MKKIFIVLALFVLKNQMLFAQHQEISEKPAIWQGEKKDKITEDSTSLLSAFKKAKIKGHFRYYFHLTDNAPGLTDYYANALGGGLKFETASFYGFQLGISGFHIFNLYSVDLTQPDPTTNQLNRYEIGLFDITRPENKSNINRPEELYVKYNFSKSSLIYGKQLINTPFINLQDGRMRPTSIEGIWVEFNEIKKTEINLGFFNRISPRSTTEWYSIGKSFGLYPVGVGTDGARSGYKNNIQSNGVTVLGIINKSIKNTRFEIWDYWVDNVLNTTFALAEYSPKISQEIQLVLGVQSAYQFAIGDGGNADPKKTYIEKNSSSLTYGARLGIENKKIKTSLNFNRIVAGNRFLMPREWGRDPFFTFMPRERNEGLADATALMYQISYKKSQWFYQFMAGHFWLPRPDDYLQNKYGMPTYFQFNLDVRYQFEGFFKGLDAQLLLVHKLNNYPEKLKPGFIFNRVDMSLVNLILNYRF